MTGSGAVQCQNPRCGALFYLAPSEWIALDPVLGSSDGLFLRCPECGFVYGYRSDSLVETEVPVAHLPTTLESDALA